MSDQVIHKSELGKENKCQFSAHDRLYMAASINGGRKTRETPPERTTKRRDATDKLSHIPTLAKNGECLRPLGASGCGTESQSSNIN